MDDKNDDTGSSKSSSSGGSFEFVDQLEIPDANQDNSAWQDILGSGDLLKKVLKAGTTADDRPVRHDVCVINYECSCEDVLIEKKDNFKIQVGDAEMTQAMDLILPLMEVGEKDEVIVKPRFGYGSIGLPPDIPPNSTLRYIVELISCQPETEAESMDTDRRLAIGNSKKERGNFWFSRQDYTTAIQCYKRSLTYLEYNFELLAENPDFKVPSPNEDILLEDRTKVYNNLAAAQMKLKLNGEALTSVDMALCLQPQNVKAWFRKLLFSN